MDDLTQHRIEIETSFIFNLIERHRNGEKHIKCLLTLYIHEFELHPVSLEVAKLALSII